MHGTIVLCLLFPLLVGWYSSQLS